MEFGLGSSIKAFIATVGVAILGIIGFNVIQAGMIQPLLLGGAVNMTTWSPQIATIFTSILPLGFLVCIILIIVVLLFRRPQPANPYMEAYRQQSEVQRMVQRKSGKQPPNQGY